MSAFSSGAIALKTFTDHLLCFSPKDFGLSSVPRIGKGAFAHRVVATVLQDKLADMLILAAVSADLFGVCGALCPDRGGCALRDRLELEERFVLIYQAVGSVPPSITNSVPVR
jgi:hypothetical protein